mmetsp:Transcript_39252/g.118565  ORF Transcript_39252/g.118565 Transcript_39252/m.118565 type:complete len:295 (-) Transcript_39252:467-1351(-)
MGEARHAEDALPPRPGRQPAEDGGVRGAARDGKLPSAAGGRPLSETRPEFEEVGLARVRTTRMRLSAAYEARRGPSESHPCSCTCICPYMLYMHTGSTASTASTANCFLLLARPAPRQIPSASTPSLLSACRHVVRVFLGVCRVPCSLVRQPCGVPRIDCWFLLLRCRAVMLCQTLCSVCITHKTPSPRRPFTCPLATPRRAESARHAGAQSDCTIRTREPVLYGVATTYTSSGRPPSTSDGIGSPLRWNVSVRSSMSTSRPRRSPRTKSPRSCDVPRSTKAAGGAPSSPPLPR